MCSLWDEEHQREIRKAKRRQKSEPGKPPADPPS